ncbi:hypothetical protein IAU59_007452 [Kwoniella sp. CBS 9459]
MRLRSSARCTIDVSLPLDHEAARRLDSSAVRATSAPPDYFVSRLSPSSASTSSPPLSPVPGPAVAGSASWNEKLRATSSRAWWRPPAAPGTEAVTKTHEPTSSSFEIHASSTPSFTASRRTAVQPTNAQLPSVDQRSANMPVHLRLSFTMSAYTDQRVASLKRNLGTCGMTMMISTRRRDTGSKRLCSLKSTVRTSGKPRKARSRAGSVRQSPDDITRGRRCHGDKALAINVKVAGRPGHSAVSAEVPEAERSFGRQNNDQGGSVALDVAINRHVRDEIDDDLDQVEEALLTEPSVYPHDTRTAGHRPTMRTQRGPISVAPRPDTGIPPPHIARYIKSLCDARTLTREIRRHLISHPLCSTDHDAALRDLFRRDWSYLPMEHQPTSVTHVKSIASLIRQRIISIHALFQSRSQHAQAQYSSGSNTVLTATPAADQHSLLNIINYIDAIKRPVDHVTPEETLWLIRIGMPRSDLLLHTTQEPNELQTTIDVSVFRTHLTGLVLYLRRPLTI